jgi:hypothetical protein
MPDPIRILPKPLRPLLRVMVVCLGLIAASIVVAEGTPRANVNELPALLEARDVVQVDQHEEARVAAPAVEPEAAAQPTKVRRPRPGFLDLLFGRAEPVESAADEPDEFAMDSRMVEAAHLAQRAARRSSINRCWRYVKRALQAAHVVECYPKTALAKQAAVELPQRYGFERLDVEDPFEAPVGAVLVYGGRGAGHVEIRTEKGFVSDHASLKPSPRPLIGVFVKPCEG